MANFVFDSEQLYIYHPHRQLRLCRPQDYGLSHQLQAAPILLCSSPFGVIKFSYHIFPLSYTSVPFQPHPLVATRHNLITHQVSVLIKHTTQVHLLILAKLLPTQELHCHHNITGCPAEVCGVPFLNVPEGLALRVPT